MRPEHLLPALPDPSSAPGAVFERLHDHPAATLSPADWPPEALERQEACGIAWDWHDIVRFLGFIERHGDCLFWGGAKSRGSGNQQWYGSFWTKGKTVRAHKFAAVAILGLRPVKGRDEIDHDCHQSLCVGCLVVRTRAQNQARIRRHTKREIELAAKLNLTPAEVMSLPPEKLATYERMLNVAERIEAGEQSIPGVIVCKRTGGSRKGGRNVRSRKRVTRNAQGHRQESRGEQGTAL